MIIVTMQCHFQTYPMPLGNGNGLGKEQRPVIIESRLTAILHLQLYII